MADAVYGSESITTNLEFIRPEFVFEREFGQFRNWWARDIRIVGNAFSLLMYLVSHHQRFRITQQKAREDLGLGKDAFRAARDKLAAAGFLAVIEGRHPAGAVDHEGRPVGGHRYVVYRLLDPAQPETIREIMREEASADNPTKGETALLDPVDNSPEVIESPAHVAASAGNPSPENPPLKEDQSQENQESSSSPSSADLVSGAAGPPHDDEEGFISRLMPVGLANLLREIHPRLDGELLVRRLTEIRTIRVEALDLERAAVAIILGSARAVGDPVAYVAKSIQREPWRWVKAELLDPAPSAGGEPTWAAGRTAAQEAADVRSARARGIVPAEWPEHRPLNDAARHALDHARRRDMDRQHLDSLGKEIHV